MAGKKNCPPFLFQHVTLQKDIMSVEYKERFESTAFYLPQAFAKFFCVYNKIITVYLPNTEQSFNLSSASSSFIAAFHQINLALNEKIRNLIAHPSKIF